MQSKPMQCSAAPDGAPHPTLWDTDACGACAHLSSHAAFNSGRCLLPQWCTQRRGHRCSKATAPRSCRCQRLQPSIQATAKRLCKRLQSDYASDCSTNNKARWTAAGSQTRHKRSRTLLQPGACALRASHTTHTRTPLPLSCPVGHTSHAHAGCRTLCAPPPLRHDECRGGAVAALTAKGSNIKRWQGRGQRQVMRQCQAHIRTHIHARAHSSLARQWQAVELPALPHSAHAAWGGPCAGVPADKHGVQCFC
jgi:hypothetical protein